MSETQSTPIIADEAPSPDHITDYDRSHFATYLSLLHALGEGKGETEMARLILGIDPILEPGRADRALRSHIRRARWLSETGYRQLLTVTGLGVEA